jgi:glycosyltransferase involved in cell wall biosynthesis
VIVDAVIPALDEEASIGGVLDALPAGLIRRVVVCDNGSRDRTAAVARAHGASTVREERRGYGSACLRALDALRADPPDAVLFLDADGSDDPSEATALLAPLRDGRADLVIGSRARGSREPGALLLPARFGNWLATGLIRFFYGVRWTDLGPFRAVRWDALEGLAMRDPGFGWTVEMQVKAARAGLRGVEMPVRYRRRIGRSKISGTLSGAFRAGVTILGTIAADVIRHGRAPRRRREPRPPVRPRSSP